jgi:flotillin
MSSPIIIAFVIPIVFLIVLIGIASIYLKLFLYVGNPNQVFVFSGRKHKLSDGRVVGYRYCIGGRHFMIPTLEQFEKMDLSTMPVDIKVDNAYSKGQIMVNVKAYANVKISSEPKIIHNAIERFLGQSNEQIANVAKETLEGHFRGVIASIKPEEIIGMADEIKDDISKDFKKMGIHLDALHILEVTDSENYLSAPGIKKVAELKEKLAKEDRIDF